MLDLVQGKLSIQNSGSHVIPLSIAHAGTPHPFLLHQTVRMWVRILSLKHISLWWQGWRVWSGGGKSEQCQGGRASLHAALD